ncbi:MAG: ATP-binding protein [Bryobacteraceae bacterium]
MFRLLHLSLLWKILLSTSIAITLLFAFTGWIVQEHVIRTTSLSLEDEVKASFRAYESLWRSRAEMLSSVSLVLSRMSDVRAAFTTGDQATIRDTAGELWSKISREQAIFLVTDPRGSVIASLGGPAAALKKDMSVVRAAARRFPEQISGFMVEDGRLYQIVVTPVYVEAGNGPGLLNVLVAGYAVDGALANRLKQDTGGSDFVFLCDGRVIASTLAKAESVALAQSRSTSDGLARVTAGNMEYMALSTPLLDVQGKPVGTLQIGRSFAAAQQRIAMLRRDIIFIWLIGILAGLALTSLLARRILEPVRELDRGASELARGNYDYRVPVKSQDELGRLAQAFNAMSGSIQEAREDLIRQERISTIGRLSTSIVHDLRNPLAAIYGGAEMLVDGELSGTQIQRLARNIYRSSRRVQELLQELIDVPRGKVRSPESCRLREVIEAAAESYSPVAALQSVSLEIRVPEELELPLERARMERVFLNLIGNALEAMPDGGCLRISAEKEAGSVVVRVADTGPGIAAQIRPRLFQPFVSSGKKNGLGLGLALSHQTVIDHGGELWLDQDVKAGARFCVRLPV